MAALGITPSGTHLLTDEQEIVLQNESAIMGDVGPWHVSVRFAYLAGGVCDDVGMRNELLRRRDRYFALIEESKTILKQNKTCLFRDVGTVHAAGLSVPLVKHQGKSHKAYRDQHDTRNGRRTKSETEPTESESWERSDISDDEQEFHDESDDDEMKEKKSLGCKKKRKGKCRGRRSSENEVGREQKPKSKLSWDMSEESWDDEPGRKRKEKRKRQPRLQCRVDSEDSANEYPETRREKTKRKSKGRALFAQYSRDSDDDKHETSRHGRDTLLQQSFAEDNQRLQLDKRRTNRRLSMKSELGYPEKAKKIRGVRDDMSDSDIDDQSTPDKLHSMRGDQVFDSTKLHSAYSFEKMFAHRQHEIKNYKKLLAEFGKPFKQKKKWVAFCAETQSLKQPTSNNVQVIEELPLKPSSPPFILGKLRDFEFLRHRHYLPDDTTRPEHPKNQMTAVEFCENLILAMQTFVVRKERATTTFGTFQYKSRISVTFTKRAPCENWRGIPPMIDSRRMVAAVCQTLKCD